MIKAKETRKCFSESIMVEFKYVQLMADMRIWHAYFMPWHAHKEMPP